MQPWKSLTKLLLITLLALSASGVVSAKVASGLQNLGGAVHPSETAFNPLMHLAKIGFSYDAVSGFPLVTKRGAGDLVDAAGGIVKNAKKGDIRAPGGRDKAKELFREFDTKGVGSRTKVRERDGSRAVVGELGDGTPLRRACSKNITN